MKLQKNTNTMAYHFNIDTMPLTVGYKWWTLLYMCT